MKVLGLDLSTKTGYAVLDGGRLTGQGLIRMPSPEPIPNLKVQEFSQLVAISHMVKEIIRLVSLQKPDVIYAEQTNGSSWRNSQKLLEFIHCVLLLALEREGFASKLRYVDTSKWRSLLQVRLNKDQKKHNAQVSAGKIRGRITTKHLSVMFVNSKFNLQLKLKDNDIADACCVALAGEILETNPTQHGTIDQAFEE